MKPVAAHVTPDVKAGVVVRPLADAVEGIFLLGCDLVGLILVVLHNSGSGTCGALLLEQYP